MGTEEISTGQHKEIKKLNKFRKVLRAFHNRKRFPGRRAALAVDIGKAFARKLRELGYFDLVPKALYETHLERVRVLRTKRSICYRPLEYWHTVMTWWHRPE